MTAARLAILLASLVAPVLADGARAQSAPDPGNPRYQFETPVAPAQNRVYWLDRASGIVGACQYQTGGGPNGTMACFEPGEGSINQAAGDYALLRSAWVSEFGIFRVDQRSGRMALCFVRDTKVVCTPQSGGR